MHSRWRPRSSVSVTLGRDASMRGSGEAAIFGGVLVCGARRRSAGAKFGVKKKTEHYAEDLSVNASNDSLTR